VVRILPVNDDNTIPGTVVVVEVATVARPDEIYPDRWQHTFRVAYATAFRMEDGKCTREKSTLLIDAESFWTWVNFVRRAGSPVWLFGSQMGLSLTLLKFWELLTTGEFSLNRGAHPNLKNARSHAARAAMMRVTKGLLVTGGPPTAVVCFHHSRWKLTAVSIENYCEQPQEKLAKLVSLDFQPWPNSEATFSDWSTAAEARCRVTVECVKRLIVWHAKQELGRFSLTISGVAMASLRHRFMRDRIELPEDQDERDWQREGYFNGRVEALWTGKIQSTSHTPPRHVPRTGDLFEERPKGPFHILDARSFYGGVCSSELLPSAATETHLENDFGPPPTDTTLIEVMARVLIETQTDVYPVRRDKGCIHARGVYWTTLCGPELVHAVRHGHVKAWKGWQRFRLEQTLKWFADSFWKQRREFETSNDLLMASLCKSVLARLHGKFIQRSPKWCMLPGRVAPAPWSTWTSVVGSRNQFRKFRSIGWDVQIQDDGGDDKYCFPALAAWVTSCGRSWLRHWMKLAGERHVFYVACDSMIVDDIGLNNLTRAGIIWPDGAGSLRLVSSSDTMEVRGPNNYTHGSRQVVSGRALRALKINGRTWTAERWQGLEELFLSEDRAGAESYGVKGCIDNFTAPGTVGPGGWIQPPYLTLENERCQRAKQTDLS